MIVKCCGKTQTTSNVRLFLKHLGEEIESIYDGTIKDSKQSSDSFISLKNSFTNRLMRATVNKQLVIILDGIDNLKSNFI